MGEIYYGMKRLKYSEKTSLIQNGQSKECVLIHTDGPLPRTLLLKVTRSTEQKMCADTH